MTTATIDSRNPIPTRLEVVSDPGSPDARLEQGLGVLHNLLGMIRLPQSAADEHAALAVLHKLAGDDEWPSGLRSYKGELLRHLELLTEPDVSDHLAWFEQRKPSRLTLLLARAHPRAGRTWSALQAWIAARFGSEAARRGRSRLLFVLLAMIAARVYRFTVLGALAEKHIVGGHDQLDALLAWLRERRARPGEVALVREYLSLVRDELYAPADHMRTRAEDLPVTDFAGWPWTRQILGLEYRRGRWDRGHQGAATTAPNPVHCAGELEYRLARARGFARLARRGGIVAAASLRQMGYRDASVPTRRWPIRLIGLGVLLLAAAAVMGTIAILRLRAWDRQGAGVAAAVIGQVTYGETRTNNAGARP